MNQEELIRQFKSYSRRQMPPLSLSVKEKVKQQVLNNLSREQYPEADIQRSPSWTFVFTRIAVMAVCLLILLTGSTYASFDSLPGDTLYPLKRTVEDTQVKLTQNPVAKTKLQVKFAEKRFQELESLEAKSPKKIAAPVITKKVEVKIDTPKIDSLTASPTETEKLETEDNPKENFAKREISRAIYNLENTRTKLEKDGHTEEANNLNATIKEFTRRVDKHRERKIVPKEKEIPSLEIKSSNRQKETKHEENSKRHRQ